MARPANDSSQVRSQPGYRGLLASVASLLEQARGSAARTVNSIITTTYWEIGRRIVEHEQEGKAKPGYGEQVIERLSRDLTARFGRGFSRRNVFQMRQFHLSFRTAATEHSGHALPATTGKVQTPSALFGVTASAAGFSLPWSHYVRLLSVESPEARAFYAAEALRGGWSVRQLDRQISTLFFERTAHSRRALVGDRQVLQRASGHAVPPEQEIKDPLVLEFLARRKRPRVGDEWYGIDLLLCGRPQIFCGARGYVGLAIVGGEFQNKSQQGTPHNLIGVNGRRWNPDGSTLALSLEGRAP